MYLLEETCFKKCGHTLKDDIHTTNLVQHHKTDL